MQHVIIKVLILAGMFLAARDARGELPALEIPADLIMERFAVANNGDLLLVPVSVAGKVRPFVVDTGATGTLFDSSIPLGHPFDVITANGAEGKVKVKLHRPPDATVGRTSLGPLASVAAMDLKSFRQVSGHPIDGFLGMDFLGRYVVHIDIEKGVLLLLKSVPTSAGVEVPISWEPGDTPFVVAGITPGERVRFQIDTGATSVNCGSVGVFESQSLVRKRQFNEIGKTLYESLSGTVTCPLFLGGALDVGGYSVRSPIFRESHGPTPNVLSLGFWSRFAVTFNFPGRKLYIRKSAKFDRPDRWNSTGLHLWKSGDSIEVCAVDADSPAARAGLNKGDLFVELNGRNAVRVGLFEVRQALCEGGELTCVVRREAKEKRVRISQAPQRP
jgi:predicted aspartyl protease